MRYSNPPFYYCPWRLNGVTPRRVENRGENDSDSLLSRHITEEPTARSRDGIGASVCANHVS
jgi:hypothetical protein